ncbi:MAG: hypothetical protein GOMPHAMPRED_004849 [Gomphillus americanus]|uniref:Nephrocystin 3-like N-terminal domain-containing protein n=1 Tax=Gomphillus americanus TaxID=1940652 RepID=A0A8H3EHI8_9LECA|nr:MAG: hypothetical protein GOMPHAMPRED_004849 [Gomphillus americanus]
MHLSDGIWLSFEEDFKVFKHKQKSAANAICALLRQLLEFYPELITRKMLEKFNNDRPLYVTSVATLWEEFIDANLRAPSNEIICVLDALDECQEPNRFDLIKNICEYAQDSRIAPKIKLLVTSRLYSDVKHGFYDFEKVMVKDPSRRKRR